MERYLNDLLNSYHSKISKTLLFYCCIAVIISVYTASITHTAFSQETVSMLDPSLKADLLIDGISSPTSMAFITNELLLISQKDGTLSLANLNSQTIEPVLQLNNVISKNERGFLGLEKLRNNMTDNTNEDLTIFIYVTEEGTQLNNENIIKTSESQTDANLETIDDLRNRVYKVEWDGESFSNPRIILDLPAGPGTNHQGGKMKIGPDNQLYVVIGELQREGVLQNIQNGPEADDSGVILRVDPDTGEASADNPFNNNDTSSDILEKYFAYGIRNSFGFEFDPVTGKLWMSENGQDLYDEINLVEPGFNSGWKLLMGPIANSEGITVNDLVTFQGAQYVDPLVSWEQSRGITDIEFFNSSKFGLNYQNNIFVGDITGGNLFFFEVNEERNGLEFNSPDIYNDLIISKENVQDILIGSGFKGITDIETGPDGNLYILTFDRAQEGQGALYRISSIESNNNST